MTDANVIEKVRKNVARTKRAIWDSDAQEWVEGRTMPQNPGGVRIDVIGSDTVTVMLDSLPEPIIAAAACFGLKTMLTNIGKGNDNEYTAEDIQEVVDRLQAGHWASLEGRGTGLAGMRDILAAIETVYQNAGKAVDIEALKARLKGMDEEAYALQRKTFLKTPAIKLEVERRIEERRQVRLAKLAEEAESAELPDL